LVSAELSPQFQDQRLLEELLQQGIVVIVEDLPVEGLQLRDKLLQLLRRVLVLACPYQKNHRHHSL